MNAKINKWMNKRMNEQTRTNEQMYGWMDWWVSQYRWSEKCELLVTNEQTNEQMNERMNELMVNGWNNESLNGWIGKPM